MLWIAAYFLSVDLPDCVHVTILSSSSWDDLALHAEDLNGNVHHYSHQERNAETVWDDLWVATTITIRGGMWMPCFEGRNSG